MAAFAWAEPQLFGQAPAAPPEPIVGEIEIEFKGVQNVGREAVMVHVQIREGMEFEQNLVDRSIRSLYATRLFESIVAHIEDLPGGEVKIIFLIQPKYRVSQVRIIGNAKGKTRRLEDKIESRDNGILDERQVRKDRDAIFEYYVDKGFTNVTVDYRIERDDSIGYGAVTFIIDEGKKLKIRDVDFAGNEAYSGRKLRKTVKTKKYNFFSWLSSTGRFSDVVLQEDLDRLRDFYKDEGYLDINISDSDVTLSYPSARTIAITVNVVEGRQYQVGDVMISGNTLFQTADLMRSLNLRTGDIFSPTKLDEDRESLTDFYGLVGYLDTFVRADRRPNISSGAIDINYGINEGERVYVESIGIEGNTKTKNVVILRELALAPGQVFNLVRMKNSQARLENTRFFDNVNLSPEPTNLPGRRNLKVSVREGRTGQFQFGAGFSSLQSGVFFAELTQGNFDLFNWRSFFQGDGQKFRLRFSIGSQSNEFVLAFEEPWLFEQRLALGVEFFRTETDFVSSVYNELRTGFEVYMRKRVYGLWEGRLSYRFELVDIFDVNRAAAPQLILDEEGERTVSKIGFSLLRDTRNNLLWPTQGSRTTIISEFAGLGGDTKYIRLEGRFAKFIPTFDFGNQVLAIIGHTGVLFETGDEEIPFFDRFFMGGPSDLRGFTFRQVGPKDLGETVVDPITGAETFLPGTGDPVGGNTKGFASVEYTIKIADPLRVAIFYDWGFVNVDTGDWSTANYNSNWGFGLRLMVLNNPLRLDFGIPITTDPFNENDGNEFNFNFGTRF